MVNSNRKGKVGERELAEFLSTLLGVSARRGQQYCGIEGKDIVGTDGVHIECKRANQARLNEWLQQATDDASINEVALVCWREDRGLWKGVFYLSELVQLSRAVVRIVGMED